MPNKTTNYVELYGEEPWWVTGPAQKRERERQARVQEAMNKAEQKGFHPMDRLIKTLLKRLSVF